jgi:hypothetical protein
MLTEPNIMKDKDIPEGQRDTHRVLSRLSRYLGTWEELIVPFVSSLSLYLSLPI